MLEYWIDEQPLVEQVAEKRVEMLRVPQHERKILNGINTLRSPRRRTPTEVLSSLLVIPYSNTPLR